MEFRDFDAERTGSEPSGKFKLGGKEWSVRSADDISWALIQKFTGLAGQQADGTMLLQIRPFFRGVLIPEQVEEFCTQLLDAEDSPLSISQLEPLISWIVEQVTGRPTKPVRRSSPTRKSTGRRSTGGSSSPATRKKRSAA